MRLAAPVALLLLSAAAHAQVFEGEVPEQGRFFEIPFDVPPGTRQVRISHSDLSPDNILDWGVEDPNGFRGYGGGNEEDLVIGVEAASRSYLAGPLPAGRWKVTVGKAKIKKRPARYRVVVTLSATDAGLTPQPERRPYVPVAALSGEARWYAGDFHVHSRESGDARPPLDEIATYARSRGLDFVHLSDHNTTSTLDFIRDAQARHPALLLVPGVEYTTYKGHANAVGATRYVSPRLGEGISLEQAAADYAAQGAVFSINHPTYDVGDSCIGCAWELPIPRNAFQAIEIATGGWDRLGRFFTEGAIAYWDWALGQGHRLAAIGGSDDHRAGAELNAIQSPIGEPTTMVFARELSVEALLEGVRNGRTVVKLQGPGDPMIELTSSVPPTGDTVLAREATLSASVTGDHAVRGELVWVHNGVRVERLKFDRLPFGAQRAVTAPAGAEDRFRAEVWLDGRPRTVTSHLFVAETAAVRGIPGAPPPAPPTGCGCASGTGALAPLALAALLLVLRARRSVRQQAR